MHEVAKIERRREILGKSSCILVAIVIEEKKIDRWIDR